MKRTYLEIEFLIKEIEKYLYSFCNGNSNAKPKAKISKHFNISPRRLGEIFTVLRKRGHNILPGMVRPHKGIYILPTKKVSHTYSLQLKRALATERETIDSLKKLLEVEWGGTLPGRSYNGREFVYCFVMAPSKQL